MNWADFYLVCFLVGFMLSAVALLMGHFNLRLHFPHFGLHGPGPQGGVHGAGTHPPSPAGGHSQVIRNTEASPVNFATVTAFLAWFGGSGYLLTRYYTFWHMLALGFAALFGLAGAGIVFWFLRKLSSADENLDPADYEMTGALGRVVSIIRAGGTGEMVYAQGGTRHTAAARSEDGSAIPRGTEVVVTRFEKGIAYVRRWEDLAREEPTATDAPNEPSARSRGATQS
jgi:membrane protein implicated in regulation of membrane protease activity